MGDSVDRLLDQWGRVRPDLDVAPMGVIGRLSRLTRVLERQLDAVYARHDLHSGEFDLLATLYRAGGEDGLTAGELAASAMVTSGAITNRLDRMVAKDLVDREHDPRNRRTVRVRLTHHGRQVLEAALTEHLANEEKLLSALDSQDRRRLEDLLRRLLIAHES